MNSTAPAALTPYEGILATAKRDIEAIQNNRDLSDEAKQRQASEIQQRADAEAARLAELDIKQADLAVERADAEWREAYHEEKEMLSKRTGHQMIADDDVRTLAIHAVDAEQIEAALTDAFDALDVEEIRAWKKKGLPLLLEKVRAQGYESEWSKHYPTWERRINEMYDTVRPRVTKAAQGRLDARSAKQATQRRIASAAHYSGRNGYGSNSPLSGVGGGNQGLFPSGGVTMPRNYVGAFGGR